MAAWVVEHHTFVAGVDYIVNIIEVEAESKDEAELIAAPPVEGVKIITRCVDMEIAEKRRKTL